MVGQQGIQHAAARVRVQVVFLYRKLHGVQLVGAGGGVFGQAQGGDGVLDIVAFLVDHVDVAFRAFLLAALRVQDVFDGLVFLLQGALFKYAEFGEQYEYIDKYDQQNGDGARCGRLDVVVCIRGEYEYDGDGADQQRPQLKVVYLEFAVSSCSADVQKVKCHAADRKDKECSEQKQPYLIVRPQGRQRKEQDRQL